MNSQTHCPGHTGAFWFTRTSLTVTPLENHHTNPIQSNPFCTDCCTALKKQKTHLEPQATKASIKGRSPAGLYYAVQQQVRKERVQLTFALRWKRNCAINYSTMELRQSLLAGSFLWLLYVRFQQWKKSKHKGKLKANLQHLTAIHSLLCSPNGLHFQKYVLELLISFYLNFFLNAQFYSLRSSWV